MNILRTLSGKKIKEESSTTDTHNMILGGLQPRPFPDGRNSKNVYSGTVSSGVKASRRRANKIAKASRKKNRSA